MYAFISHNFLVDWGSFNCMFITNRKKKYTPHCHTAQHSTRLCLKCFRIYAFDSTCLYDNANEVGNALLLVCQTTVPTELNIWPHSGYFGTQQCFFTEGVSTSNDYMAKTPHGDYHRYGTPHLSNSQHHHPLLLKHPPLEEFFHQRLFNPLLQQHFERNTVEHFEDPHKRGNKWVIDITFPYKRDERVFNLNRSNAGQTR